MTKTEKRPTYREIGIEGGGMYPLELSEDPGRTAEPATARRRTLWGRPDH